MEALEKQYADVLSPLKENLAPKKFGLKYVQKLAKRSVSLYTVPDEVRWHLEIKVFFHMSVHWFKNSNSMMISAGGSIKFHEEDA